LQAIKFFTEDYPAGRPAETSPSESSEQCSESQRHPSQDDDVFEGASLPKTDSDGSDIGAKTAEVGPGTTEPMPTDKTRVEESLAQNGIESVGDKEPVTAAQSVLLENLWTSLSERCQVLVQPFFVRNLKQNTY
jgi:hypothetical protein